MPVIHVNFRRGPNPGPTHESMRRVREFYGQSLAEWASIFRVHPNTTANWEKHPDKGGTIPAGKSTSVIFGMYLLGAHGFLPVVKSLLLHHQVKVSKDLLDQVTTSRRTGT